jgi:hypothetical protein
MWRGDGIAMHIWLELKEGTELCEDFKAIKEEVGLKSNAETVRYVVTKLSPRRRKKKGDLDVKI